MRVIAISACSIGGLENIGIVMFQKNMEFGRDFRFFLSSAVWHGRHHRAAFALSFLLGARAGQPGVRPAGGRVPQLFHARLPTALVAVPPGRHLVVLAVEHR